MHLYAHKSWLRNMAGREVVRHLLGALVPWRPLHAPEDGFSLILGVPWDLRHLLGVNLRFVERTDVRELRAIHVVFDRAHRDGMEALEEATRRAFPDLPLVFHHYPTLAGRICERVNVSTFYNSLNCCVALREITTRHAVLHDFDLYPLEPDHFTGIVEAMRANDWRFSGAELTRYDGLEDDDRILGTWSLGMDVEWLRRHWRPRDVFHQLRRVGDRLVRLDPFSTIQLATDDRGLAPGPYEDRFCHVKNLCSTYLRISTGRPAAVAWRLHYLWYLESVEGGRDLSELVARMNAAGDRTLEVDGMTHDLDDVDPTCANVLEREVGLMERFLHGEVRAEAQAFVDAFRRFLDRSAAGPASHAA